MSQNGFIICCHDCGLLQQIKHMPEQGAATCCRCDAVLRKHQRILPAKSIEHALALVIAGNILFILANVFPVMHLQVGSHEMAVTLFACVEYLYGNDMLILAGLVFITSIGAPLVQLAGLLYVLLPINFNHVPAFAPQVYRYVRIITSWSMMEVLMVGILVSVVKLSAIATVIPGIGLWAIGALIFMLAAILASLDSEMLWNQISTVTSRQEQSYIDHNIKLTNCHNCNLLNTLSLQPNHLVKCNRCQANVHYRKPDSLTRCTAFLIAAVILYIPANLLPVMVISSFGKTEGDTIMSGVIYLAGSGDWPLALIVFIASIVVPSIKLIILSMLLFTVHFKSHWRPQERTRLYRLTELIGRWSMVDIFVDTLMAALVQIQGIMVIEVGIGAFAFGAVVVLTMLAAMAFDPRLIWDNMGTGNE